MKITQKDIEEVIVGEEIEPEDLDEIIQVLNNNFENRLPIENKKSWVRFRS